ncbi:MAG: carboxypeptidase-like regulatory domain-containing protein [Verrucomicrobiia bacterium]
MNTKSMKYSLLSMSLAALWICGGVGSAATLTVTPSAISNTYSGVITLDITGVTNGEKVAVETYLDLNANGSIDPGEPMMDAFKIADGGAMVIGGITNINVPFDGNSATGAITTTLNFAPPLVLENIVGQKIYRLVSPGGNFSPVTATLLVTNAVTGQTLSGTVYSNGITPLPNAVVVVLPPNGNGYTGAVVADSNGHYNINVNPGSYGVMAAFPNFIIDQSLAPQVTLTNGMSATNDISLNNGTITLSGNFYDAGNSNGIGGMMVQLESGNLFGIGFTDSNGNYSAAVAPAFWKVKPTKERSPRRAYVISQQSFQVDATGGNVTNANVALYTGNALFYGRITDNASTPFANIEFAGNDSNNQYSAKGYGDANGYYTVAVLGDTNLLDTTNFWNSNPDTTANVALANYVLNGFESTNILAGQAIRQDYVALPVTASISGQVRDNLGNPVVGVELYASTFISGNGYQSLNGLTDNSGNYTLGVTSGSWQVYFSINGGSGNDLSSLGLVDYFAPYNVTVPPTNAVRNITVYQNGTPVISQPQRFSPTQFGFNINGGINVNYTVQVSPNLAGASWSSLFSLQLTNSPFLVVDPNATNSPRFYRVQKN